MFNNKKFEGIHYSRFVASWTNTVGPMTPEFIDWMKTITVNGRRVPDDVIDEIYEMGNTGMFELEISAVAFAEKLKNNKKESA